MPDSVAAGASASFVSIVIFSPSERKNGLERHAGQVQREDFAFELLAQAAKERGRKPAMLRLEERFERR